MSSSFGVPAGGRYTLTNARVVAALTRTEGLVPDREGLAIADIEIGDGRILAISPPGSRAAVETIDLKGGQVWPAFVDLHTHLDKGHIWQRARNPDGTHETARLSVAADRQAHWRYADVRRRFDFGLRCALAHGTAAIRTHLDSYELAQAEISWAVFADLRREWQGRIDLQPVAMARIDQYQGPDGARLVDLVEAEQGLLGGILKIAGAQDPVRIARCLDRVFAIAAECGLDIDLHIDETHDITFNGLAMVAAAALRADFQGKVNCGHCCSLANQPDAVARETIQIVADAGLTITCLPMVNLYLQDRTAGRTPRWRGIAPVQELRAAGVPVIAASDNCRDPFFAFGDHDGLEVFREFVRIAHLDLEGAAWADALARIPADIMALPERGRLAAGLPADLVLFKGRSMDELLARPQADRVVLRRGVAIDTTLPDYAELDSAES